MAEAKKNEEKPQTPKQAVKEAVKEADPPESADTFPVERLISEGDAFIGHPPHVVAGALSQSPKKNLTLEEAEAAVDAWLKTPVTSEEA